VSIGNVKEDLRSNAFVLGGVCSGLDTVVDLYELELPYLLARILRNKNGVVSSIVIGEGYGMQIGNEDEAFPV